MISPQRHFLYPRHGRPHALWSLLFAALLLCACGKKGPLYLPTDATAGNFGAHTVSTTSFHSGKN